jgi:hypothetical protein
MHLAKAGKLRNWSLQSTPSRVAHGPRLGSGYHVASHLLYMPQGCSPSALINPQSFNKRATIYDGTQLNDVRRFVKGIALVLIVTLTLLVSGSFVIATFPPTYPVGNFDFTISASTTLVRAQPGSSAALVIWVSLFCPNSTTTIKCDSTVLQSVALQSSGCPSGSFCMLDRTQVLVPPLYGAGINFLIYSFSFAATGVTTVTVTGTDQFGHSHSTQFGVILCNC